MVVGVLPSLVRLLAANKDSSSSTARNSSRNRLKKLSAQPFRQRINPVLYFEGPIDFQCQVFTGELINNGEPFQTRARMRPVKDEVPTPDIVAMFGRSPVTAVFTGAKLPSFLLFLRHFQPSRRQAEKIDPHSRSEASP